MVTYRVTRHGGELFRGTEAECWRWLHDRTGASVAHLTEHEGYAVTPTGRDAGCLSCGAPVAVEVTDATGSPVWYCLRHARLLVEGTP